jgi:3-oxoadipate enol-lactonase
VDGARIAYDRYGEGAPGPTVVFVHAFALNRMMWEPQLEELRGAFEVLAPDMRGHGSSDVTGETIPIERMADDVRALVASLELAPVALVGLSMGGYVALAYARKYPADLAALVLADTRASADSQEAREGRYAMIEEVTANGPAAIAEQMLPKLLCEKTLAENQPLVASVRRMIETTSAAGIAGALAGMAEREDARSFLPSIAVPTLVIAGSEDTVVPPEEARAIADAIPSARFELIENAAHLSNLEQPNRFNALVREFLSQLGETE